MSRSPEDVRAVHIPESGIALPPSPFDHFFLPDCAQTIDADYSAQDVRDVLRKWTYIRPPHELQDAILDAYQAGLEIDRRQPATGYLYPFLGDFPNNTTTIKNRETEEMVIIDNHGRVISAANKVGVVQASFQLDLMQNEVHIAFPYHDDQMPDISTLCKIFSEDLSRPRNPENPNIRIQHKFF